MVEPRYLAVGMQAVGVRIPRPLEKTTMAKILCVDDETMIQRMYSRLFRDMGEVVLASNGREAYELFRQAPAEFKVIVTDYNMPEMDGLEFLASIKGYAQPPRIMLSGNADRTLLARALEYGATAVLRKPVGPGDLQPIVRELLEQGQSPSLKQYVKMNLL